MESREILIYLSIKYDGDWDKIIITIKEKKESINESEALKALSNLKCNCLTLLDSDYPEALKTIYKPPFVLFYYGDISLISDYSQNIAVVGTRKISTYGKRVTKDIVSELSKSRNIVSGLAKGVDAVAHRTAIESGGKTIAILGSGIDYCYPLENKELYEEIKNDHLLISEYPGNTAPQKDQFPLRNRIIAALSGATVVTEAFNYSGTLVTVAHALSFGRDVMCVPDRVGSESICNKLIREGAILVENASDIIQDLPNSVSKNN